MEGSFIFKMKSFVMLEVINRVIFVSTFKRNTEKLLKEVHDLNNSCSCSLAISICGI